MMIELSEAEHAHLSALVETRPEWRVFPLNERLHDEGDGSREHKYGTTHPYVSGMFHTLRLLKALAPCRVLDIGSPLSQNVAANLLDGVEITVLDVRPNAGADSLGLKWVNGTATAIPFPDASWNVVTSLWVMGHVGDGRYGDALDFDGDRRMLREITRVLAPGGKALLGPGLIGEACYNIFNLHRIYSWAWLLPEFERAGLRLIEKHDLPVSSEIYADMMNDDNYIVQRRDGIYGLALLEKA